jgi:hypothetical protein
VFFDLMSTIQEELACALRTYLGSSGQLVAQLVGLLLRLGDLQEEALLVRDLPPQLLHLVRRLPQLLSM